MEDELNIEEISRKIDKNVTLVYYDQSHTYQDFVFKIRNLLEDPSLTKANFRDKVENLNADLIRAENKMYKKHYSMIPSISNFHEKE